MTSDLTLARLALLMTMAAAWPLSGLAGAGLVQFAAGEVQLRRGEALSSLAKGAELDAGDVVLTGSNGRAQIRFSDGGLVALYPDSQFTVTRYADGAGTGEDHFVVHLLRGGMRALTGLIGKRQPANYRVITPTAVVGIRGSAFLLAMDVNGRVVVSCEQDAIEVCTEAGCVGLRSGESVRVASARDVPVYTHTPAVLPVPPAPPPQMSGEQLDERGKRAYVYPVFTPLPPPQEKDIPSVPAPVPVPVPVTKPGEVPIRVPAPVPVPAPTPAPQQISAEVRTSAALLAPAASGLSRVAPSPAPSPEPPVR